MRLVSLRVLDVQPWSGPVGGATVVSVVAHGSWPGGLRCRFGEASASAGWSGGASRLRCLTPPSSGGVSGWVGVQLSSFHGALSSGGSFYYHAPMTASGATPPIGPERGGTRVTVLGGGFRDAYTLRCAFGSSSAPVLARYVDESQLECSSPLHAAGSAAVLLSMNGQQYASSGVSFTYQPSASVSYISPASALSEGGTPVTVHGAGFSSASEALGVLTCRIGGDGRRAVWASSSAIVCNATRASAGEARVEVSNNAREYTSSGVRLRLVSLRVLDVHPWSGPVGGATVVSVVAHGSWPGDLRCRFGESASSAGWSGGASRLRCLTPPSSGGVSGWVGVQLSSFHGALERRQLLLPRAADGERRDAIDRPGARRHARDACSAAASATRTLCVARLAARVLRCSLGTSTSLSSSARRPVHAAGSAAVLLSMNGQQYASSGVSFTYQPSASVSYISPATALSEGGTPVTVHGAGFSSASEALGVLTCRIGGAVRRAVWASSSAIVCNATRAAAGEARVEVSNNAREYTSSGVRLRLVSLRVLDVQPWSGPVGGATVVSVVAHGSWPGGLRCRFGEASASAGLERRRVASALPDAAEQRRRERLGRRAALELPRRALERRQLLLPRADDGERRDAIDRP